MKPTLEVEDLWFSYDGPLLQGVNLTVLPGHIVTVLGPSGVGKSSLLRLVAGLEQPERGDIRLGASLRDVPVHARRVGYMTQEPALFPHLNVEQNVRFGMRYAGVPKVAEAHRARELLAMVDLHDARIATARVDELSGGQRQRVALARTLGARPRALLLDEPLSALDRPLRSELAARIKAVVEAEALPTIWVTHDPEEAATGHDSYRLTGTLERLA